MRLFALCVAAAAALSLAACSGGEKAADAKLVSAPNSVDRMSKEEIRAIVKEYLLEDPEILVEAFTELENRQHQANFARMTSHSDDPSIGPKDAKVTIVEFFDYNCGYCKAANDWLMKEASDRKTSVRVVFKEFPILRESSEMAAKAALAAGKQGKYREMHVALMKSKLIAGPVVDGREDTGPTLVEIERIAKSVGLNVDRLKKDMQSDAIALQIQRVHEEAAAANIGSTPGFYINGQMNMGFDEPKLDQMIAKARADAGKKS
jgi:protein-disulfide isomerase